jgi:hypothetical protein
MQLQTEEPGPPGGVQQGLMTAGLTFSLARLRSEVDCTVCRDQRPRRWRPTFADSLAAGFIHPSSSPVRAGFFFVEKKDKTCARGPAPVDRLPGSQ